MKKSIFLALILTLLCAVGVRAADTRPSTWAVSEVDAAIGLGLVPKSLQSGYTNPITRAEFTSLVMRLRSVWAKEGLSAVTDEAFKALTFSSVTFSDTKDENVLYCAALGIVDGVGENRFEPDGLLTRQQAAKMLYHTCDVFAPWVTTEDTMITTQLRGFASYWMPHGFTDGNAIQSWARGDIHWCYRHNVMAGVDGNAFEPDGTYTREQAILTTLRLYYVNGRAAQSTLSNEPDYYPIYTDETMTSAALWLDSTLAEHDTAAGAKIVPTISGGGGVSLGGGAYASQEDEHQIRIFDAFDDTLAVIASDHTLTLLGSANGLVYIRDLDAAEDIYYTQTGAVAYRR